MPHGTLQARFDVLNVDQHSTWPNPKAGRCMNCGVLSGLSARSRSLEPSVRQATRAIAWSSRDVVLCAGTVSAAGPEREGHHTGSVTDDWSPPRRFRPSSAFTLSLLSAAPDCCQTSDVRSRSEAADCAALLQYTRPQMNSNAHLTMCLARLPVVADRAFRTCHVSINCALEGQSLS